LNQSKIMNVIDSKSLERDAGGKTVATFPHPALAAGKSPGHAPTALRYWVNSAPLRRESGPEAHANAALCNEQETCVRTDRR
jgi:hypothetical protein